MIILPLFTMAHISGMEQISTEVNGFTGEMFNQAILLENAEVVAESEYNVWVRTSTNSLTFNLTRSVVYSEMVTTPLVAYGKKRTVLVLPKQ